MTRSEYEDIEAVAVAALIGLLANSGLPPDRLATRAFEISEAFYQEKLTRIGEKPPFDA
ncbi:hypothetical protein [Pseudomonas chlororaphis]|uniref:hypothetical protein n=1 Tax=Pseudomonas chlororaphis TaxID=587753 RepID=UPI003C152C47